MKKFLFMIGIALLMTMAQMQSVSGAQSDGYIHKNHYYAVSFDGEGDAIVRAVIDIENTLGTPIKWIDLELPGQVIVYKAVQEAPSRHVIEYEKQLLSESTILRLELKEPIQQRGTGTIVLFYKIPRYANQDIGGNYKFDFETIIDNDAILIEGMRIAVNVQEGLQFKEGEAKIDYKPNLGFMGETAMAKVADTGIESPYYRDYYYGIMNAQGMVRTAQNLDAFESFHVKGSYGENFLALYFLDIAFWIVLGGILVTGIAIAFRKALDAMKQGKTMKQGKKEPKTNETQAKVKHDAAAFGFAQSAVVAFSSAIAAIVVVAVGLFIAVFVSSLSYSFALIGAVLFLLGLVVAAAILFVPALFISSKHGLAQGAAAFFMTVFFLIVLTLIFLIIIQLLFPPLIYYAL